MHSWAKIVITATSDEFKLLHVKAVYIAQGSYSRKKIFYVKIADEQLRDGSIRRLPRHSMLRLLRSILASEVAVNLNVVDN